jgi:uncharacterized lipoprotein YehR (DUF1307 family)
MNSNLFFGADYHTALPKLFKSLNEKFVDIAGVDSTAAITHVKTIEHTTIIYHDMAFSGPGATTYEVGQFRP